MMNDDRKILEVIVFCNETIMLKSKTPSMVKQTNKHCNSQHSRSLQQRGSGSVCWVPVCRHPRAMQSGHAVGSESARQRSPDAHVKCCRKNLRCISCLILNDFWLLGFQKPFTIATYFAAPTLEVAGHSFGSWGL